jgi:hypothetical protein
VDLGSINVRRNFPWENKLNFWQSCDERLHTARIFKGTRRLAPSMEAKDLSLLLPITTRRTTDDDE